MFLTFVTTKPNEDYFVEYHCNDTFTEIDLKQPLFHLPIQEGDNDIKIVFKFTKIDPQLQAIPLCISKNSIDPDQDENKDLDLVKVWTHNTNSLFFKEQGIEWLGSGADVNFKINVKLDGNNDCILNGHTMTDARLIQSELIYKPNQWLVCVKSDHQKHLGNKKGVGETHYVEYHMDEFIHVQCSTMTSKDHKFNYVTIGDKTFDVDKIVFMKKINSLYEFMQAFNVMTNISKTINLILTD